MAPPMFFMHPLNCLADHPYERTCLETGAPHLFAALIKRQLLNLD